MIVSIPTYRVQSEQFGAMPRTVDDYDAAAMDVLRRLVGATATCDHKPHALPKPQAARCQECGSDFNLRLCASCGHVGCCESQQGHARAHALGEGHHVIHQMPAPQGFIWCYEDRAYVG
jgi:uncharacterized UBP type Zn finger protein